MTETDAALPRETGQEKATATCPTCGGELGVQETPYGSTAPTTCPKCYPATDPDAARQQASQSTLQRQQGTPVVPTTLPSSVPGPAGSGSEPGGE